MDQDSTEQSEQKPFQIKTVRGEPYHVAGRTLIPEARLVSFGQARATIGSKQVGGWSGGLVQVTPTAIIEQTADGERRISLADATSRSTLAIMAAGAATVLFFTFVRLLARAARRP